MVNKIVTYGLTALGSCALGLSLSAIPVPKMTYDYSFLVENVRTTHKEVVLDLRSIVFDGVAYDFNSKNVPLVYDEYQGKEKLKLVQDGDVIHFQHTLRRTIGDLVIGFFDHEQRNYDQQMRAASLPYSNATTYYVDVIKKPSLQDGEKLKRDRAKAISD